MRKNLITRFMLSAAILSFVLTGCNAGKSDAPGAAPQSVTGVAATGAPIIGAVFLQDSSEPAQAKATTTAANGSFSLDVSGLTPPFVLAVEWTDFAGHNKMYSFAEQPGTANINPLTNVVFAAAAGIPDQVSLAGKLDPAQIRNVASRHRAAMENLRTALAPLLEQYQAVSNPVSDRFEADHTGLDAMFDDVKIFVNSGMIIVRNKGTSKNIFQGPIDNISSGIFHNENIPVVAVTGPGSGQIDGAALYAGKCGSCHGALATSTKRGSTATQIQAAIGNVGVMNSLSSLTPEQVQAIASALASTTTTPPSMTSGQTDGAALYGTYCAGCHGPLASSNHRGATASDIQAGISNVNGMKSLSTLSSTQIQAIAAALGVATPSPTPAPTPAPTDGAALYATYCSGCHGPLASSSHRGATASDIQAGISNVSGMKSLSTLSSTQIQAIADALGVATPPPTPAPTPAPTDGAALYATYCSGCHGPLASSNHRGATASDIQAGISNVSGMKSLSTLSSTQIQAIADALVVATPTPTPTPTPAPTDGAVLYASWCGSCHGVLASSTKLGRTSTQIQSAITSVSAMRSLSTLTTAQIDAIAAALATTSTTPPPPPPLVCGSCHAIPPATGQHNFHVNSEGLSCGTCHGTGYSSTAVNAATHNNGVKNIASGSTPGWNPTTRTCSNSCHGTHNWGGTTSTPTPTPTPGTIDGAALYTQYCSGCHGALATSGHRGATVAQIQSGINTISGMMSLSTLTLAELQAISDALNTTTPTPTPTPTPLCGSCHAIPPATGQHSRHQSRSCSTCHGTGYSSTAVNAATHNNGVKNIASGSTPGWNPTTRTCSNSCHGTHNWGGTTSTPAPTPTPTPVPADGATLYATYCAGCHGALATSGHRGATVAQIQTGINTISGMMSLSTLTLAELQAISDALNSTSPTPPSTTPPPLVCGSCHAIPPSTGHHSTHESRSCSTCHGTGYSSTTVNSATHNNGVKNIASGSTPGWNPTTRSCSNSCHGTERW